jgi:hypothetical protein
MDIFTYTPGCAETIDAFNQRLAAYAAANSLTAVRGSQIGSTLVLSLATFDEVPNPVLVRPFVAIIASDGLPTLETALTELLNTMKAEDDPTNDVYSVPIECRVYAAPHGGVQAGYAVFQIGIGELEDEE